PVLEPANRIGAFGVRIGKSPGATARIALAAGGALGRIGRARRKAEVVATWSIITDLGMRRRAQHGERRRRDQQTDQQIEPVSSHSGPFPLMRPAGFDASRSLRMLEKPSGTGESSCAG